MSRSRRCLFFPGYRGGGFGHVSRCLALAEELTCHGWKVAFVLGGPHVSRLVAAGWTIFRPPLSLPARLRRWRGALFSRFRPGPAYFFFSDLNFQVVRDGFHTPQIVQREVEWELEIVNRFRPDVLVSDFWLLTSIVGRLAKLPVVQIVRAAAHPASPQLVWWRDIPVQICSPDVAPVFNPVLERWGIAPVQRAEDLLDGDLLLVPSIPELDPLPPKVERTHYVGPLVQSVQGDGRIPDWLAALPRDRPVVYVTVGGGSDSVRGLDLLPFWKAAFAQTGWEIVVSTGGRPVPRRWQHVENLQVFPWVPGAAMVARADVVLFHGGYGTLMETVRAGVPSVVIPFHTEQESNGRRLQQSGAARVLAPGDEVLEPVKGRWGGGQFATLVCKRFSFQPHQIQKAVSAILCQDSYRDSAMRLQHSQDVYGGAALVLELLKF
ncbi:MAG: nucleotide disphospho-sugar-binding domain-containing protein [Anaerolineae bacterium]